MYLKSEVLFMLVQDSSALWRSRLQACANSDMTVKQWCETHDCTLRQYYYWKRRLNLLIPADNKSSRDSGSQSISTKLTPQPTPPSNSLWEERKSLCL